MTVRLGGARLVGLEVKHACRKDTMPLFVPLARQDHLEELLDRSCPAESHFRSQLRRLALLDREQPGLYRVRQLLAPAPSEIAHLLAADLAENRNITRQHRAPV